MTDNITLPRATVQQALEALLLPSMKTQQMLIQRDEAIIALRRALEQQAEPVPEPVATVTVMTQGVRRNYSFQALQKLPDGVNNLYTSPQQQAEPVVDCPRCGHVCSQRPWVGLTDEDINRESAHIAQKMKLAFHAGMYVAQQILKEKNSD